MDQCKSKGLPFFIFFILTLMGSGLGVLARSPEDKPAVEPLYDQALFGGLKWRNIGPPRGGRVTAVAGDPVHKLVFYMGSTGGGVWKTEDAGLSWHNISDKYFKTGSVGAVAVAPSDPNVVYVGMGEACVRGNLSHGDGVYKSLDAGKTWSHVGLDESRQIGRIAIDPRDPNLVYVAALGHVYGQNPERGVFRSQDGGKSWKKVLYVDDKTGAVDLSLDPSNPRVLYAALWQVSRSPWELSSGGPGSGLYRSTDGGDHWTELKKGLPEGIKGRIGVSVSPVDSNRVYAIVEAEDGGVFRSDDSGDSWRRVNSDRSLRQRAWYYTHIFADTQSVNTVYVLNTGFYKSTDAGKSYQRIRPPHGDNHALWIDPKDPSRMINGNDGGVNVTLNGGKSWTEQNNQSTAQFYHVITDNQFPYRVYGAQQDNSTMSISSQGYRSNDWYAVGGGESGYIAVDPRNPDIVYAGSYGGLLTRYDHKTETIRMVSPWPDNPMGWGAAKLKYRFQWTYPILISQHDPRELYAAANVVFKSTDEGQSWQVISPDLTRNDKDKQGPSGGPITKDNTSVEYYCTIFALAESPRQHGLLWSGSDDGLIHVTMDGGKNWKDVTPPDMPEWGRVSIIEPSHFDAQTAYVAVNRYQSDDLKPYIFKTADLGKSWTLITQGIPDDAFTRVVREDPERRGLLYAGTETGAYVSFDDGSHWQPLQLNLPVVPITDLAVKGSDLVAATQGRSFWVLSDLEVLRQVSDQVASSDVFFYKPSPVVRGLRGGANVYYFLKEKPDKEVKLEFLDSGGKVIRTFTSRKAKGQNGGAAGESRRFFGRSGSSSAPATKGLNHFVWNERYADAVPVPGAVMWAAGTAGPAVAPGTYQVRLTAAGKTLTQTLEIKKDPRFPTSQQALREQFDLLMKIRDRVSDVDRAINRIRAVRRQVEESEQRAKKFGKEKEVKSAADSLKKKLKDVEVELIQVKSRSSQDPLNFPIRLNNKMAALSGAVARNDRGVTRQSKAVFDELSGQIDGQLKRLRQIMAQDVPAFNQVVAKQKIPAILIEEAKTEKQK